ncbi:trc, partial [Symbiodinium sp. CCMP2456]
DSEFTSPTQRGAGSMLPPLVAISRGGHGQPNKDAEAIVAKKPVVPDRFAEKAANFKAAVEGSKLSIEREHQDRLKRHEMIDDGLSAVQDEQRREAVMDQFQEQEKRLAVAKCRHWSTADLTSMAVLGAAETFYTMSSPDLGHALLSVLRYLEDHGTW